ncbi:major coat protein [Vibrio cholerae]|uniref:major coat protein n=1 Tax=Vibrio cholerae TaxID=666 RepID=UPI003F954861
MKKTTQSALILASFAAVAATGVNAAIPAEAQAALDSVGEFSDAVISWMWGVGTAITVAFVGLKLVRKGANKAS